MNRQEFVNLIATTADLKKGEAEKALNAVLDTLEVALQNGETNIQFTGYFGIKVKDVAQSVRPNPQKKGEKITVPAHKAVKIKAGSKLKEAAK